eukprot:CFRG1695T1
MTFINSSANETLDEELTDATEQMLNAAIAHTGRCRERILDSLFRWLCRPLNTVKEDSFGPLRRPSLLPNVKNTKRRETDFASSTDDLTSLALSTNKTLFTPMETNEENELLETTEKTSVRPVENLERVFREIKDQDPYTQRTYEIIARHYQRNGQRAASLQNGLRKLYMNVHFPVVYAILFYEWLFSDHGVTGIPNITTKSFNVWLKGANSLFKWDLQHGTLFFSGLFEFCCSLCVCRNARSFEWSAMMSRSKPKTSSIFIEEFMFADMIHLIASLYLYYKDEPSMKRYALELSASLYVFEKPRTDWMEDTDKHSYVRKCNHLPKYLKKKHLIDNVYTTRIVSTHCCGETFIQGGEPACMSGEDTDGSGESVGEYGNRLRAMFDEQMSVDEKGSIPGIINPKTSPESPLITNRVDMKRHTSASVFEDASCAKDHSTKLSFIGDVESSSMAKLVNSSTVSTYTSVNTNKNTGTCTESDSTQADSFSISESSSTRRLRRVGTASESDAGAVVNDDMVDILAPMANAMGFNVQGVDDDIYAADQGCYVTQTCAGGGDNVSLTPLLDGRKLCTYSHTHTHTHTHVLNEDELPVTAESVTEIYDTFVLELLKLTRRLHGLSEYDTVTAQKLLPSLAEIDITLLSERTVARLQSMLYKANTYRQPNREVRIVARETMDKLFPQGMHVRRVVSGAFRIVLYPLHVPASVFNFGTDTLRSATKFILSSPLVVGVKQQMRPVTSSLGEDGELKQAESVLQNVRNIVQWSYSKYIAYKQAESLTPAQEKIQPPRTPTYYEVMANQLPDREFCENFARRSFEMSVVRGVDTVVNVTDALPWRWIPGSTMVRTYVQHTRVADYYTSFAGAYNRQTETQLEESATSIPESSRLPDVHASNRTDRCRRST